MKIFFRMFTFLIIAGFSTTILAADTVYLWFAPSWKAKPQEAKAISVALKEKTDINILPRIAGSYPDILNAFKTDKPSLVYAGSFVSAIIRDLKLGEGLVQSVNGKEMYSGILVYKKGQNPENILKNHPDLIAFAKGASSGEASAKAATDGKASIKTRSHTATLGAVKAGKAKAGVVKNWWWEGNKNKYPDMAVYLIPGVSELKNPDYVISASNAVSKQMGEQIVQAAKGSLAVFHATEMREFDPVSLDFTLHLMEKGHIVTSDYKW